MNKYNLNKKNVKILKPFIPFMETAERDYVIGFTSSKKDALVKAIESIGGTIQKTSCGRCWLNMLKELNNIYNDLTKTKKND